MGQTIITPPAPDIESHSGPLGPAFFLSGRIPVGTSGLTAGRPRTDPYVRLYRIRLPPRVFGVEASGGLRMDDARLRKPSIRYPVEPFPGHPDASLLTSAAEGFDPVASNLMLELFQHLRIPRYCVVVEVPSDHGTHPFALRGNRLVSSFHQVLLHLAELGSEPLARGLPRRSPRGLGPERPHE